jgi:hypothetical protein
MERCGFNLHTSVRNHSTLCSIAQCYRITHILQFHLSKPFQQARLSVKSPACALGPLPTAAHLDRKAQSAGQCTIPFHRHPTLPFHFHKSFPVFPSFKRPTLHDDSIASPWTSLPPALSPTRLRVRKRMLLSGRLLRVPFDLQRRDIPHLLRALGDELNRVLFAR